MKKRCISLIVIAFLVMLVFPISSTSAEDASKLIVYYDFDGNFDDELNGSTLTAFGEANDGYNHNNATSLFGSDTGAGDVTYWQWTSTLDRGGGFWIDVDDLNILENYSIGVRFVFDDIDPTSWDKIIDYKDRVTDHGFYFHGQQLEFYPQSAAGDTFSGGDVLDVVATRDAATGQFIAYTIENGVRTEVFNFDDSTSRYAIPAEVNGKVRFGFFHDDNDTSREATSGGKVYSIKIWNGPITEEQATGAMDEPTILSFSGNNQTAGTPPSTVIEQEGSDVTIPANTGLLKKTGMNFSVWNTQENGSGDDVVFGSTYTMPANDEELFAKWVWNTYTVQYNPNGGSGTMPDQSFVYNTPQNLNSNVYTKDGFTFAGWATTLDGSIVYNDTQNVKNLTEENCGMVPLYAQWTKIISPLPTPTPTVTPTSTPTAVPTQPIQYGTITTEITYSNGDKVKNKTVELHSNVITGVTDSNGRVTFSNVALVDHTLIIKDSSGSEMGRVDLDMAKGTSKDSVSNGNEVDVTFTDETVSVVVAVVLGSNNTVTIDKVTITENPSTGNPHSTMWLWLGITGFIAIAGLSITYYIKKTKAVKR